MSSRRRSQTGQILLIVILVTIVASTIGLSLASRTITNLRTSTEEAESQKALAAAELGMERAIQGSVPIATQDLDIGNNSGYSASFSTVQSSSFLINGGNVISKDEGADVWFIGHNPDGSLDYSPESYCPPDIVPPENCPTSPQFLNLYWGSSSDGCSDAAIQAVIVTRNSSSPNEIKSYRYVYDACLARRSNNNFTSADTMVNFSINGVTFKYSTFANDLAGGITPASSKDIIFMRVVPLYKDAVIGVSTCNPDERECTSLSSQGYDITSTGQAGEVVRKLTVFKGYPQTYLPYVSYGLFVAAD